MPIQQPTQLELSPEEQFRLDQEEGNDAKLGQAKGLIRLHVLEQVAKTTKDPVLKSAATKTAANLNAIQAGQPATDFYEQVA